MKKTLPFWLFLSAIFSFLFYNERLGINLSIFALLLLITSVLLDHRHIKNKFKMGIGLMTLLAAGSFTYYGNLLSGIGVIAGILVFSGYHLVEKLSIQTAFVQGFSSSFASVLLRWKKVENWVEKVDKNNKNWKRLTIYFMIVLIFTLFLFLYRAANPIFEAWTNKINFNFISFPWLLFTAFGAWIIYGLLKPLTLKTMVQFDATSFRRIDQEECDNENYLFENHNVQDEYFGLKWILILLNGLILIVNVGDLSFLINDYQLPENVTFASYLHRGVGTLILSIVISIAIILYFFRGKMNFLENSKTVKILTYVWLTQNVILLLFVVLKNGIYIDHYGLTYKRIGVFTYTLLTFLGLLTTFLKVHQNRRVSFLFHLNGWFWFIIITISTTINWDRMIILKNQQPKTDVDIYYLLSLSDNCIPELQNYTAHIKNPKKRKEFSSMLNKKIAKFKHKQSYRNYKSWTILSAQIMKDLK